MTWRRCQQCGSRWATEAGFDKHMATKHPPPFPGQLGMLDDGELVDDGTAAGLAGPGPQGGVQ